MHAYDLGLTPLIHFGLKYIFCLAVIHLFVTAYLSKSLNLSEKSSKMIPLSHWPAPDILTASGRVEAVRKWSRLLGYSARAPGTACERRTALYCRSGPP